MVHATLGPGEIVGYLGGPSHHFELRFDESRHRTTFPLKSLQSSEFFCSGVVPKPVRVDDDPFLADLKGATASDPWQGLSTVASWDDLLRLLPELYPELEPLGAAILQGVKAAREPGAPLPTIAVLGRFASGKSSLINALLETTSLPMGPGQTSAHLVRLSYGTKEAFFRLGSGKRKAIAREDFLRSNDLQRTATSVEKRRADLYEVELPSVLLKRLSIIDCPGADGAQAGISVEAEVAMAQAARAADLCLIVVHKGLDAETLRYARLALEHCSQLAFVLNKSDQWDAEQLEEVRRVSRKDERATLGKTFPWIAVSPAWQMGSERDKARIRAERDDRGDDPEPCHEWSRLVDLLELTRRMRMYRARLQALETTVRLIRDLMDLQRRYDLRAQAERWFLARHWKILPLLKPPLGPKFLQIALDAARASRAIPWEVLRNSGIEPDLLAPNLALEHRILPGLREKLLDRMLEVLTSLPHVLAEQELRHLLEKLQAAFPYVEHLEDLSRVRSLMQVLQWRLQAFRSGFTAASALRDAKNRWLTNEALLLEERKAMLANLERYVSMVEKAASPS